MRILLVAGTFALSFLTVPDAATAGTIAATCAGQPATMVGTAGDDLLSGTAGDEVIQGLGGNDTITGGGGHDLLCGGAGDDSVSLASSGSGESYGGPGDDQVFGSGEAAGDVVSGGPGNDHLVGGPAVTTYLGGRGSDSLTFSLNATGQSTVDLGPDRDFHLRIFNVHDNRPIVNLATGRIFVGQAIVARLYGTEITELDVRTSAWGVVGSDRGEHVDANLSRWVNFYGYAGNDSLVGTRHDDSFWGGPGFDSGRLKEGTDFCRGVEQVTSCEVS